MNAPRADDRERRSRERLEAHYRIEKELASRLRGAGREERVGLYTELYDELYRRVPDHPQRAQKHDPGEQARSVAEQLRFLGPMLSPDMTYLEIGAGDCAVAAEVARRVRHVVAVEVSTGMTAELRLPPNLEVRITDGTHMPVADASVDLAYSNQVMEHLHPDDALEQLRDIARALHPGARYLCITPNRLNGPHDISRYFDTVATGFHLREYATYDLVRLFRGAGFRDVRVIVGARDRYSVTGTRWVSGVEHALEAVPHSLRRRLASSVAFRWMLGGRVVATR
jgi:SAM-dependent methyltransferase